MSRKGLTNLWLRIIYETPLQLPWEFDGCRVGTYDGQVVNKSSTPSPDKICKVRQQTIDKVDKVEARREREKEVTGQWPLLVRHVVNSEQSKEGSEAEKGENNSKRKNIVIVKLCKL